MHRPDALAPVEREITVLFSDIRDLRRFGGQVHVRCSCSRHYFGG